MVSLSFPSCIILTLFNVSYYYLYLLITLSNYAPISTIQDAPGNMYLRNVQRYLKFLVCMVNGRLYKTSILTVWFRVFSLLLPYCPTNCVHIYVLVISCYFFFIALIACHCCSVLSTNGGRCLKKK